MFNFDVNQLTEQMKPVMEKFASSIGTTADKLLEVGIKGMFVEGILAIISCFLCIFAFITAAIVLRKMMNSLGDADDMSFKEFAKVMIAVCCGVIMIAAPCIFASNLKTAVINTIAPDYALVLKVSSLLTESKN